MLLEALMGSQNLTTFQTFVTHNFLHQYGMATQFSEIVHNLTGFPTHLTKLKFQTRVTVSAVKARSHLQLAMSVMMQERGPIFSTRT